MTSMMNKKQERKILLLAHELDGGRYNRVVDAWHLLPLRRTELHSVTSADASMLIDHLEAALKEKETAATELEPTSAPEPIPAPEGGPNAEQIMAMLGKKITVTLTKATTGETVTYTGRCDRIEVSDLDGTPALAITESGNGRLVRPRTHRLTSWATH